MSKRKIKFDSQNKLKRKSRKVSKGVYYENSS